MEAIPSIFQGNAEAAQAQSRSQADAYNAVIASQNARVAMEQGGLAEEQQRRRFRDLQGQAVAAAAQSGAGMDGSNADVLRQNAIANELDALTIRYESQMKARGLMAQSELFNQQAQASRIAARNARIGGYIGGAAAVLQSSAKYASGGAGVK